uniref:Uncharacterized protein n=1 Tax=Anguilla anguilla TaxID=7936 RepID=A0A0E9VM92_ANGAN
MSHRPVQHMQTVTNCHLLKLVGTRIGLHSTPTDSVRLSDTHTN